MQVFIIVPQKFPWKPDGGRERHEKSNMIEAQQERCYFSELCGQESFYYDGSRKCLNKACL